MALDTDAGLVADVELGPELVLGAEPVLDAGSVQAQVLGGVLALDADEELGPESDVVPELVSVDEELELDVGPELVLEVEGHLVLELDEAVCFEQSPDQST